MSECEFCFCVLSLSPERKKQEKRHIRLTLKCQGTDLKKISLLKTLQHNTQTEHNIFFSL